jgi:hypothetical protein
MLTLGRFTKQTQFLEYFKQSLPIRRTRFPGASSRERAPNGRRSD